MYLREIGRVPRLAAPQEIDLAKRIEDGDDTAKRQLIEANLRLVDDRAKIRRSWTELPRPDSGRERRPHPCCGEV